MQEPNLVVNLEQEEAVFRCEFARLADFGVQYSVSYYGDGKLLSEHLVGDSVPALTELEMDELQYGSQVNVKVHFKVKVEESAVKKVLFCISFFACF